MNVDASDILEWRYTPEDFFEESFSVNWEGWDISFGSGTAKAVKSADACAPDHTMQDDLQAGVETSFRSVMVGRHKTYELSMPSLTRVHSNGRRDVTVSGTVRSVVVVAPTADVVVRDSAGNVVRDTKRERIDHERMRLEAAMRGATDPFFKKLQDSYAAAVDDPANELVHLYEILDALKKHFHGEHKARRELQLTERQWEPLGRLACGEPIRQGRHRGAHINHQLRDATYEELTEARAIARGLIEAYMRPRGWMK